MSLLKKIISSVCAIGVMASMAVAYAAPATNPEAVFTVTKADDYETSGKATITVSIKGFGDCTESDLGYTYFQLSGFSVDLELNNAGIATNLYKNTGMGKNMGSNVMSAGEITSLTEADRTGYNQLGGNTNIVVKKVSQAVDSYIYNDSTGEITIKPSTDLLTINVVVSDPQAGAEIPINDINYLANPLDEGGMDLGKQLTYRMNGKLPEGASASENDRILESPTSIVIEGTDSGDDEPEITQGVITKEQSGSENDEAVWAWTTAAATGNFLKVYADVTKVGATEATQVYNTFKIPATVEATNVKVGIVVQYNPTNIAEFVVTGMEIVSSAN